jgi:halocyanin-like protein
MAPSITRRELLGSASIGTAGAMAGCFGTAASSGDTTTSPVGTPTTTVDGRTTADPAPDVDENALPAGEEWRERINDLRGRVDRRGDETVEIRVGSHAVTYSFVPATLTITPGTEVIWSWSGRGGPNNVVSLDGAFDSGRPVDRAGHTFSVSFEEEGAYRYLSEPNATCGMGGVIHVEPLPDSDYPAVNRWLRNVDNFDGEIVDRSEADVVDVTTGAPGNSGHFAFEPPAVTVAPDTTVRWTWTGKGGAHDVVFDETPISTHEVVAEEGYTFEHTFESTGVFLYHCRPHSTIGQRGAVVVE